MFLYKEIKSPIITIFKNYLLSLQKTVKNKIMLKIIYSACKTFILYNFTRKKRDAGALLTSKLCILFFNVHV